MPQPRTEVYEFGPFRLDTGERMLWRDGTPIALQPRVFDTLVLLVFRAGQLVRKDELLRELWPNTHVSEANLTQNVWLLRRALGEDGGGQVYVETVPKAGYRFVAPVVTVARPAPAELPQPEAAPSGRPRWIWAVLLAFALVGLGLAAIPLRQRARAARELPVPPPRPSLAALELANLSGDPEAGWLAAALPEMFAAELAAGGEIRVLPGEAVAQASREGPAHDLGPRLGVDYLLTGAYRKGGGQVQVDLRLVDARSGETLATIKDARGEGSLHTLVAAGSERLRRSLGLDPLTADETSAWLAALPSEPAARRLYFEGLRKLRSYDAPAARELLEQAIAHEPGFPLAHAAMASAWSSLGYDGQAQESARQAADRSGSLPREGRLLVEAGFHQTARRWDEAIQRFQALFTFYPDEIEYGLRLASALSNAGRGEEALRVVARLRMLPAPLSEDPRIDLTEAQAAHSLADLGRAVAASSAAAAKGRRRGARRLVAGALSFQGTSLLDLGKPAEARAAVEQALALSRAAGDRHEEARALNTLGHVVRTQGDMAGAGSLYRGALEISLEVGNRRSASVALGNLANLSLERGDLSGALDSYRKVLALKREVADRRGEGIVLYNMAHAQLALGELAEAERGFLQALEIRRGVGEKIGIASSLQGLAMVRMTSGDLKSVPGLLREAEAIARGSGDQEILGSTLALWGDLSLLQGDLPAALDRHQESLRIRRQAQLESEVAESLSSLAEDLLESGRVAEAAASAARAVEGFRRVEQADGEAMARVTLAACLAAQGQVAEAERTLAPVLSDPPERIEARLQVELAAAALETAAGRPRHAEELLERIRREAEAAGQLPYAYEARLARAGLELEHGEPATARARLAALAHDAEARGLGLVAGKARRLLDRAARETGALR